MDYMTDVMTRLERYRLDEGLSIEQMAKRMGANSRQQYWNWKNSNSLPKTYFRRAAELLGDDLGAIAPLTSDEAESGSYGSSVFSVLSHSDKRKVVEQLLPELDAEGRAMALKFLLDLDK